MEWYVIFNEIAYIFFYISWNICHNVIDKVVQFWKIKEKKKLRKKRERKNEKNDLL